MQNNKKVVSSAAEAETGGIYMGGKHTCPIRAALAELGHPQSITGTPFETDNNTAQGILNSKMRQRLSKSFDMRYWWMKDRINQGQFKLIWAPRKCNLADYFTKHHPPWHHRQMCYKYLQKLNSAQGAMRTVSARGCVSSTHHQSATCNAIHTDDSIPINANNAKHKSQPTDHNSSKTSVSP
jgi:hypothetical protein